MSQTSLVKQISENVPSVPDSPDSPVLADFDGGQAMKTLFIALRAAIFGTGFIFLWGWVALSLHHRYDISCVALPNWARTLGIVLMVAGGTLAFACVASFVTRGEGTPAPFDPPRNFVTAGPFKYVR